MKILFVIFVSVFGLFLAGCVDQPLIPDEQYNATHGPAPYAPDPMAHLPSTSTHPSGY
jgi:hypothetical protein